MARYAKKNADHVDLVCSFGKLSLGDETVSMPIKLARDQISDAAAGKLVASQFAIWATADRLAGEDAPGQGTLIDTSDAKINCLIGETSGVLTTRKRRSATLSFKVETIGEDGVTALRHFAEREGLLSLLKIGEAEERRGRPKKQDVPGEEEDDDAEENAA